MELDNKQKRHLEAWTLVSLVRTYCKSVHADKWWVTQFRPHLDKIDELRREVESGNAA
jgi:hypothetical protein